MYSGVKSLILGMFFFFITVSLFCDDSESTAAERLQVLKYGIDSEVLELVRALHSDKNAQYQKELAAIFAKSKNSPIREEILSDFTDLKDPSLADACRGILTNSEGQTNSLVLSIVSYLVEIKDAQSIEQFAVLIKGKNKNLALASVRALGKLKAVDKTKVLIDFLKDPETDSNFKPDIFWSLGEIGAKDYVADLNQAYDEADSDPMLAQVILEALGKIGDESSWDRIQKALSSDNVGIQTKALAALGAYAKHSEVQDQVSDALKDTQAPVRLAGLEAAGKLQLPAWVDVIEYRIKKDPDPKVRSAALKALIKYDSKIWQPFLMDKLQDPSCDPGVWQESFAICLDKQIEGTYDAVKKQLEAENKNKGGGVYGPLAAIVLQQKDLDKTSFIPLLLTSNWAEARSRAVRMIQKGHLTAFIENLKTMASNDKDADVRLLADKTLKDLLKEPEKK